MKIVKGKRESAERIVIYGASGVGKSTLASKFPSPLFFDTEGSTEKLDVDRVIITSFQELVDGVNEFPEDYRTLVIDSLDWAEKLIEKDVVQSEGKESIQDFAYGKGQAKADEKMEKFMNMLKDFSIERGIHVVCVCHSDKRRFEPPGEIGAYDRWELNLSKKSTPIVKQWATAVLFYTQETRIIKDKSGKTYGVGDERVIHTVYSPAWDAKNRHGMPPKIEADGEDQAWENLSPYLSLNVTGHKIDRPVSTEKGNDIVLELLEKCEASGFTFQQLMDKLIVPKGYYPSGTKPEEMDPAFIQNKLFPFWDRVKKAVTKGDEK